MLLERLLELVFACTFESVESRAKQLLQALFSRNSIAVIAEVTLEWVQLPLACGIPELRRIHLACGYVIFLGLLVLSGGYSLVLPLAHEFMLALGPAAPQVLGICFGELDEALTGQKHMVDTPLCGGDLGAAEATSSLPRLSGERHVTAEATFTILSMLRNALRPCVACLKLQDGVFYPLLFKESEPQGKETLEERE